MSGRFFCVCRLLFLEVSNGWGALKPTGPRPRFSLPCHPLFLHLPLHLELLPLSLCFCRLSPADLPVSDQVFLLVPKIPNLKYQSPTVEQYSKDFVLRRFPVSVQTGSWSLMCLRLENSSPKINVLDFIYVFAFVRIKVSLRFYTNRGLVKTDIRYTNAF